MVVQKMVEGLREEIETKFNRLPLDYVDAHESGELMRRANNDIDNIAQTLQQTISQLLTSVLTMVGTLAMMLLDLTLLASSPSLTIPIAIYLTRQVTKRSQRQFVAQWGATGRAERPHRGDVHRSRDRQGLRASATRRARTFDRRNDALYDASASARSSSPA